MTPPPIPSSAISLSPKKKRSLFGQMVRWAIYGLVIVGAVDVVSGLLGGSGATNGAQQQVDDDAQLSAETDSSNAVKITNVGREVLQVKNIRINDRDDCKADFTITNLLGQNHGSTLKVGDSLSFIATCQPIRMKVYTDKGDIDLSFNSSQ
jgi:hypothetical protein